MHQMKSEMDKVGKPQWIFGQYKADDTQRDSVSGEFFRNTRLESVIREAIQNSLDAREDKGKAAVVRIYYFGEAGAVSGAEYASLYRGPEADAHYAHKNSGLVNVPKADGSCVFMTIEDFGTTGLTGDVTLRPTEDEFVLKLGGNYVDFYNHYFVFL